MQQYCIGITHKKLIETHTMLLNNQYQSFCSVHVRVDVTMLFIRLKPIGTLFFRDKPLVCFGSTVKSTCVPTVASLSMLQFNLVFFSFFIFSLHVLSSRFQDEVAALHLSMQQFPSPAEILCRLISAGRQEKQTSAAVSSER